MEKFMKSLLKANYISSAILFLLGLLLIMRSDDTIVAISYLVGGAIIIIGVLALIKFFKNMGKTIDNSFDIVYGIITIIFGILILSNPKMVATIIPFIIGGWILIKSSFKIAYAIELKNRGSINWKPALITSIVNALVGVLIVFNPFKTSVIVFKIIGIAILVYAILDFVSTIEIKKEFKKDKTEDNTREESMNEITTVEEIVDADIEEIKPEEKEVQEEEPEEEKTIEEEPQTETDVEEKKEESEKSPKKRKKKRKNTKKNSKDSEEK